MKINNKSELDTAIGDLQKRKQIQEKLLVQQFKATQESLDPINLIKNSFSKLTQMPGIQEGILNTIAGLAVGIISKKLFMGKSTTYFKKILSEIFEFAITNTTIRNAEKIKAFGKSIYNNLFKNFFDRKESNL